MKTTTYFTLSELAAEVKKIAEITNPEDPSYTVNVELDMLGKEPRTKLSCTVFGPKFKCKQASGATIPELIENIKKQFQENFPTAEQRIISEVTIDTIIDDDKEETILAAVAATDDLPY